MQVLITDVTLDKISATLALMDYGKTGVAYVTEALDGVDYLIGASSGNVSKFVNQEPIRVSPDTSEEDQIRASYKWAKSQLLDADNAPANPSTSGDVLSGTFVHP